MTQVDMVPHKYIRQGQVAVPTGTNHYVRMSDPYTGEKYYLQAGKVFHGEDRVLKKDEIPEWIRERIKTMNPKVLAQVGFGKPQNVSKIKLMAPADRYDELLKQGMISEAEHAELMGKVKPSNQPKPVEAPTPTVEEIQAELDAQTVDLEGEELAAENVGIDHPDPVLATSPDYSSMSRPQLMRACKEKGIKFSPSDKNADLIEKLSEVA